MSSALPAPEVSVVIPLYNEEDNVEPLCAALRQVLAGWDRSHEVVLVDDGSSDRTLQRLRLEQARDPRLRVLALARNSGQTEAMAAGFARARGRLIVSMDGDLQNDPRDIPTMVQALDGECDVACGWRVDRQDAWLSRKLPSRIANALIARLTGVPVRDNGCSLKAYRAEVIRSLRLYSDMHRFLPALSSMAGARIVEIPVRHHPRTRGSSKYGISRTFKVLADMITIKMVTQFASRPGAWFGALSVPWLLAGTVGAGAWMGGLLAGARPSIVLPSLSVLCLWLGGHFLGLSILGEMLLARADRSYLDRLTSVLARVRQGRPA